MNKIPSAQRPLPYVQRPTVAGSSEVAAVAGTPMGGAPGRRARVPVRDIMPPAGFSPQRRAAVAGQAGVPDGITHET